MSLIQGQPWPEGADPLKSYLVFFQGKGQPHPTPEQLRAGFVRRYGYEPAGVHGLGVVCVGPVEESEG